MNNKRVENIIIEELRRQIISEYLDKDYGIPLYNAAKKEFGDAKVVKTTWLVHSFGAGEDKVAKNIIQNGFSNGLSKDELNRNSMTWATGKHEDEGYSWAYKADKFLKNGNRNTDYGSSILFQASGVEYFNPIDNKEQVMFYNKSAKNLILVYNWDGEENIKDKYSTYHEKENLYAVGNVNGKPLYIGYFGDVIEWCITNFNQYKNNLLSNDTILHVSDKTDKGYEDYLNNNGYGTLPKNSINKYDKWHDFSEENDDLKNYDEIIKKEYQEFLKNHKKELNEKNRQVEEWVKNYSKITGTSFTFNNKENLRQTLISNSNLSYEKFYNEFVKNHQFYHRRRPDGEYWRK